MFLQVGFKILVLLFVNCPNCGSNNTSEITSYGGYTEYKCIDCGNVWTE